MLEAKRVTIMHLGFDLFEDELWENAYLADLELQNSSYFFDTLL